MPLVKPPSVIALAGMSKDDRHYSVQFQYNWTGDAPKPQNLGGVAFTGSVYVFDILAARTPANFPPMRSLQFSETYELEADSEDGSLIIYVPSSGQVIRIASQGPTGTSGTPLNTMSAISGVIPIISNFPTQIQFGKEVNSASGVLHGQLIASLFDFKIAPYLNEGVVNQL